MLLPSSPPAQAASKIGSNMIAARFAAFPKCNPSSKVRRPGAVLALSLIEGNPHLALAPAPMFKMRHRPGAIGEAMARGPGLLSAKDGAGQCGMKPPLADPFQPRLVAGTPCLVVTFENGCFLSAPIRLWA